MSSSLESHIELDFRCQCHSKCYTHVFLLVSIFSSISVIPPYDLLIFTAHCTKKWSSRGISFSLNLSQGLFLQAFWMGQFVTRYLSSLTSLNPLTCSVHRLAQLLCLHHSLYSLHSTTHYYACYDCSINGLAYSLCSLPPSIPICICRGTVEIHEHDLCLVSFEALGLNLSINNGLWFKPWCCDLSFEAAIWASRLWFEPQGWDLRLDAINWNKHDCCYQ